MMARRQRRQVGKQFQGQQAADEESGSSEDDLAQRDTDLETARAIVTSQVIPAVEAFRAFMLEQNRKLEVSTFLDHIEGPQIMLQISRPDGQITATFIAEVTDQGIRPYWDATSTGRVKTHWTENVPGGVEGVTQETAFEKLKELYQTDFS